MGSASGHVHRTLVPSREEHIKIPLDGTLTECRLLTEPLPPLAPPPSDKFYSTLLYPISIR